MMEPYEDDEELEGEQWHEKINHEDQAELFSAVTEAPAEVIPEAQAVEASSPGQVQPRGPVPAANWEDLSSPPQVNETSFAGLWIPRIRKFLENPTNRYATLGVGLGILAGVAVAAISWYVSNPNGRYDLGPVTSDSVGLRGRLFLKWDEKLQYRLGFEPTYADQVAGFSLATGNPPRPLSIAIQLRDAQGFELCSKEILLRFDARKAAALVPQPRGDASPAAAADYAQPDAQEAARENGHDIFDLQAGPSGQIASINAQGELSCSRSAYEDATAWSFIPVFPSLAEQQQLLQHLNERPEIAESTSNDEASPRRKKAKKPAPNTVVFFIEGDDSIVDYDASGGTIATSGRKTFLIDKAGAEANVLKGSDFPMRIHYRCDQAGNCALMSQGAGVLHTRLRR